MYRLDNSYTDHPWGHFITLLGVNSEGNIFIGDPCAGSNTWVSDQNLNNCSPLGFYLLEK